MLNKLLNCVVLHIQGIITGQKEGVYLGICRLGPHGTSSGIPEGHIFQERGPRVLLHICTILVSVPAWRMKIGSIQSKRPLR